MQTHMQTHGLLGRALALHAVGIALELRGRFLSITSPKQLGTPKSARIRFEQKNALQCQKQSGALFPVSKCPPGSSIVVVHYYWIRVMHGGRNSADECCNPLVDCCPFGSAPARLSPQKRPRTNGEVQPSPNAGANGHLSKIVLNLEPACPIAGHGLLFVSPWRLLEDTQPRKLYPFNPCTDGYGHGSKPRLSPSEHPNPH